jgi:hypothetical protein
MVALYRLFSSPMHEKESSMEPRRLNPKSAKPRRQQQLKRFRIIQLEPRIAPSFSPRGTSNVVVFGH